MPYQTKQLKKNYNGSELVPLTVQDEILEIRESIEKKNAHAGEKLELVYQAYKEIKEAHGHRPKKLDAKCSACIMEINLLLNNWLKLYDNRMFVIPAKGKQAIKHLKPKSESNSKTLSYAELLEKFEAVASTQEKRTINEGKKPKKAQIIEFFTPKNNQDGE